jgi:hypothetical protein
MRRSRGELRRFRLAERFCDFLTVAFFEVVDLVEDCARAAGVSAAKLAHKIRSARTPTD